MFDNNNYVRQEQTTVYTQTATHKLYPSWRPLHFLLVPIMQELYFLVLRLMRKEPQSGHTVLTSTHPPFPLSLYSLSFSFSLCQSIFLMSLTVSTLLPPFVSSYLPCWPTQIHTLYLLQEKAHTNKHAMFSHWRQDVPQIEGYFHMSLTWFKE